MILIPFAAAAAWAIFLAILWPFGAILGSFESYSTEDQKVAENRRPEHQFKKIENSEAWIQYSPELSVIQRQNVYGEGRRILDDHKYWFFGTARSALETGLSKFIPAMLESDEAEWQRQKEESRLLREQLRREKQERQQFAELRRRRRRHLVEPRRRPRRVPKQSANGSRKSGNEPDVIASATGSRSNGHVNGLKQSNDHRRS